MKTNPSGAWKCPLCGFVLMKSIISAETGNVSVNRSNSAELCPNDGEKLKAVPMDDMGLEAPGPRNIEG
jgi:hypothetical protein